MFLSVKEMELRKIRFDETFEPGQIDFAGEDLEQASPLHVDRVGRTAGAFRRADANPGPLHRGNGGAVRPLSGARALSAGCRLRSVLPARLGCIAHEEEVEIDEGEAEIGFYEDGGMELEDILREQVLLALPMQRVCSEACKGICPVCGKNRNETECDCQLGDRRRSLGRAPQVWNLKLKCRG